MSDHFANHATGLESPASSGFPISPNDDNDLVTIPRALYIGTGGHLAVTMNSGQTLTFQNLPDGALLPIRARRILTASTAAALIGLY